MKPKKSSKPNKEPLEKIEKLIKIEKVELNHPHGKERFQQVLDRVVKKKPRHQL